MKKWCKKCLRLQNLCREMQMQRFSILQTWAFSISQSPRLSINYLTFVCRLNPLCAQLSIFISNLSFFLKFFVLVPRLILSQSRWSSSNRILKLSIKVLLFFSASYLMFRAASLIQVCFTLSKSASMSGLSFSLSYLLPFSPVFSFCFPMQLWTFCASGFHFPMSVLAVLLSCSSESDLYHTRLLITHKVISISPFWLEGLFLQLMPRFSPRWLLVNKAVSECNISLPANMLSKPIGQGLGFDFIPKLRWAFWSVFFFFFFFSFFFLVGCPSCQQWKMSGWQKNMYFIWLMTDFLNLLYLFLSVSLKRFPSVHS